MTYRLVIMFRGRQIEEGKTREVISDPLHPYTKLLISSIRIGGKKENAVNRDEVAVVGAEFCPYVAFCPYAMKVVLKNFLKLS